MDSHVNLIYPININQTIGLDSFKFYLKFPSCVLFSNFISKIKVIFINYKIKLIKSYLKLLQIYYILIYFVYDSFNELIGIVKSGYYIQ